MPPPWPRVGITVRTIGTVLLSMVAVLVIVVLSGLGWLERALHQSARQETMHRAALIGESLEAWAGTHQPHEFPAFVEYLSAVTPGLQVTVFNHGGQRLAGEGAPGDLSLSTSDPFCGTCHLASGTPLWGPVTRIAVDPLGDEYAWTSAIIHTDESCRRCHPTRSASLGSLRVRESLGAQEHALGQLWRSWLLTSGLALLLLSVLTVLVLRREIIRPLLRLARRVEEVGAGNLDLSPAEPYPHNELGELARGFEGMVGELRAARGRQQQVIDARTRQVESLSAEARELQVRLMQIERLATVGELSAMVAHEIRQPLNALSINLQLASRALRGATQAQRALATERIGLARAEVARLNEVVERFLSLGRGGATQRGSTDVSSIIHGVIDLLTPAARRQGVAIEVLVDDTLTLPCADAGALWQIFINLVNNALQSGGQRVQVRASTAEDGLLAWVEDDGPGVPEDQRRQIFRPFFSTKQAGTGLGLAIVSRLVEQHGGTIQVEERPGGGARFVITLPSRGGPCRTPSSPPQESP